MPHRRLLHPGRGAGHAGPHADRAGPTLVGSFGSTEEDVIAVYELLDSGQLDPLITTIGFAEIGSGLEQLRRGEARGPLVAVRD